MDEVEALARVLANVAAASESASRVDGVSASRMAQVAALIADRIASKLALEAPTS